MKIKLITLALLLIWVSLNAQEKPFIIGRAIPNLQDIPRCYSNFHATSIYNRLQNVSGAVYVFGDYKPGITNVVQQIERKDYSEANLSNAHQILSDTISCGPPIKSDIIYWGSGRNYFFNSDMHTSQAIYHNNK